MPNLRGTSNCGMRELYLDNGYEQPPQVVAYLCTQFSRKRVVGGKLVPSLSIPFIHVIFSENLKNGYGAKLAAYIEKQHLGYVVSTKTRANPNTSNPITAYIWTLNRAGLAKWWKAQKKEK